MAKKHGRGRGRPPKRQHVRHVRSYTSHSENAEDQELFQGLRRALRAEHPHDLLITVSGLLEVTDPRGRDPLGKDERRVIRDELIDSFIGTSYAETTAALTVMKAMVSDETRATRIGRELATRRHPMPDWLGGLEHALVEPDVWLMTEVLGDGDDYFVGITLPSGHNLSAVIYVDHNLGGVVKDAFVVAEPLEHLVTELLPTITDDDQTLARTDPATARAVIEDAIEVGSRFYPPLQSDTWPMCRPLVEWLLRMQPSGGIVPERKEWSDEESAALAADFFSSRFGADLDRPDERGLLETVLWFGTGYGPGDPLRWSPVNVEIILADWFPRKVVADVPYLAKLPALLRAFIRYCHDRRGIRPALTEQTVAAVGDWEPEYQRLIRSDRLQGAEALLAGMLQPTADEDILNVSEIMLAELDHAVGGRFQLQNLDDEPLPDEPFEWAGVPEEIHPVVQEMLDACDRCAEELLDMEHRTAMRRFLSRAAAADPAVFQRKASPIRGAAAVAWVICKANSPGGLYGPKLSSKDLLAWFGQKGAVSQRAEPLLRANGVDPHSLFGRMNLGVPDLLTSKRRAEIIAERDHHMARSATDQQS